MQCFIALGDLSFNESTSVCSFLAFQFPIWVGDGVAPEMTSASSSLTCNPQQMGVLTQLVSLHIHSQYMQSLWTSQLLSKMGYNYAVLKEQIPFLPSHLALAGFKCMVI